MNIAGPVYACVRPEQVRLGSNGANSLEGRVEEVFRERFGFRIIVNVGRDEVTALVDVRVETSPLGEML